MNGDCSQTHEFLFIQNFDHTQTYVDHCHKRLLISYKNIFCPLYTYGQTHPSTSRIGAALQSRAGASVLQRLAQAIPKNLQVEIFMISQDYLPSAGWWYGSSFDSLRVRLMLVSRVLHAGGASCKDSMNASR